MYSCLVFSDQAHVTCAISLLTTEAMKVNNYLQRSVKVMRWVRTLFHEHDHLEIAWKRSEKNVKCKLDRTVFLHKLHSLNRFCMYDKGRSSYVQPLSSGSSWKYQKRVCDTSAVILKNVLRALQKFLFSRACRFQTQIYSFHLLVLFVLHSLKPTKNWRYFCICGSGIFAKRFFLN